MCAIAGMAGAGADSNLVQEMTQVQRHRGPDGEGLWQKTRVVLGHCRLKIIDLTDAGRQPMSTADGRYTIVYNGEIYNYRELRNQLQSIVFRSQTDTEVLLYAFQEWGAGCLERLVGMYAFAIWDDYEKTLFCARDRLGIKPFYYTQQGDTFVFASEIRGLAAVSRRPEVNLPVLYDFLARDFYEHTEETFFLGIHKLAPGHWMKVREGQMQAPQRYWDFKTEVERCEIVESSQLREEQLLHLAGEAVKSHLISDVPIGIALSGGLDSALLLALLDRSHPDPAQVESFSFVFSEEAYSERPYIEAMARHTGRRAHFVEMSPQTFRARAERFCEIQEEPFAGAPISAYSLCFEEARKRGVVVMMDGSGIDEGLAGYGRFQPAYWADLFKAGDWNGLKLELLASGVVAPDQRARALSQMKGATQPDMDAGVGQDLTRSVRPDCLDRDFAVTAPGAWPAFEQPFSDYLRNLMYRELRYTKLPRALRFRDRLSMAVGMELRPPFLDHRLLAYEFALPTKDRICWGRSKVILRRAAVRLLPDAIRMASKRSVQTPQREWFRGELQDWVRERIDTASFWNRGWVDRKRGLKAMEEFFQGEGDNSFFLWQWINLEIWARQFLDASR